MKMSVENAKSSIQSSFFEKVRQVLPSNLSLVHEIADVLNISVDGAYRRLRCETLLNIEEMATLCHHYNIAPDFFASSDETSATFHFQRMINDEQGFGEYVKKILSDLQMINAANPRHIIYAAGDLPLFIQFLSPEFSAFKTFFWKKAMLSLPSMEGKLFSASDIHPQMAEMCKRISDTYIKIPSTEIWHQDTVASNLNLIEFAWESGMFASRQDALFICTQLSRIIELVEKNAEKSSKFREEGKWAENEGNFTMYKSEFVLMNNHIFVTAGNSKTLFLTHNTFNSMSTNNQIFCSESEDWLKNLIRKSERISGEGEMQRQKFFRYCQSRIAALSTKISNS